MIYGRWGEPVTVTRHARLEDVQKLDGRKPDKADRQNLAKGCYVVVEDGDGKERLYALAFLRADGGSVEIGSAIEALGPSPYKHLRKSR